MAYNTDAELISKIARRLSVSFEEAKAINAAVVESMVETLTINAVLDVRKLGKFTLRSRKNSLVRNPRTGQTKRLPLMYYVGFNAAHSLKAVINDKAKEAMKNFRS